MESITYPELSNIRRHRRARHEVAVQEGRFNEHEAAGTTATIVEAQSYNVSALSEYDQIGVKDEETLGGFEGYLAQTEIGLPEDEDTLFDDVFGPVDWNPMCSLKHDNDLSHLAASNSIYHVETEKEESVLHDADADYADAASLCTDPEEEEEEALLCLPQPSCQAPEGSSRIFSPRMAVSPGWLSDFINTPVNRGDREAKEADWSSIVDHVDFDYEDCHSFIILELGVRKQVPMKYQYAQGIQEVHRKLRHRYGDPGFRKAFAVFQDIMEFKDVDLVHSDEGPQWNSWRGDYRKRLDDVLNGISPAGLVLTNMDRAKRQDDIEKALRISGPKGDARPPGLDANRVRRGLHGLSNPSAGERLASQTKPKVSRSRRVHFKIAKNVHKKQYDKEVEISGREDVTKKLAKAPFMMNLKANSVKRGIHHWGKSGSSGRSSSVTKAEQAERDKITPWEKYEAEAPIFQDVIIPACDQDPRAPSVPLVPASRKIGLVAALKKSISIASFKLKKKESSATVQSEQAAFKPVKKSISIASFKPKKKKESSATVQSEQTTFKPVKKSISIASFKLKKKESSATVHSEQAAFKPVKKSISIASFKLKKKKSSATVQSEQAASAKGLGLNFRTFGPSLPSIEEASATFITPTPLLGGNVPPRVTQLSSPVHCLTPEEHIAAARRREGRETLGLRRRRHQSAQKKPKVTPRITEQLEAHMNYEREFETAEPPAQQGSVGYNDPYERRLTPLLPPSILMLPESGTINPFRLPESNITDRNQLSRSNIASRRRVVKPVSDDDSDDTIVPTPGPRVPIAQRNQEFVWHVPAEAHVRLRPRRAPDPMTPSAEMMAFMQPHQIGNGFDPVSFGLGPRDRPENVLVTQHKVKQVYLQQPGLWTPKTSEINF